MCGFMAEPPTTKTNLATVVLVVVPLLALLVAALWYAASAWVTLQGPPMPAVGYVAMVLGIVFSLLVGFGLMALLFYSNRHGYDDPHGDQQEQDRGPNS
jgi:hypothetical protein